MKHTFQVFDYIEELDCFLVNKEYEKVAAYLGLTEWSSVVWIGRYFLMDNDFGEHWFDNWAARDEVWHSKRAEQLGYDYDKLLVIDPDRFKDGRDGPCHSATLRKKFWTDVLTSLQVSLHLMIEEARLFKAQIEEQSKNGLQSDEYIEDLEERIKEIIQQFDVK